MLSVLSALPSLSAFGFRQALARAAFVSLLVPLATPLSGSRSPTPRRSVPIRRHSWPRRRKRRQRSSLDRTVPRHESPRHRDACHASSAARHTLAAFYAESSKSAEARQALLKSIERRTSEEPTSSDWFVLGRISENYGVHDAAAATADKHVDKEEASGLSTWELARRRMAVVGMK